MAGYLDQYGVGDERREKTVKRIVLLAVALVVTSAFVWWLFHNYREERQVKRFFQFLAIKDYKSAYGLWGCTDAAPCRDYPLQTFLEDWGPQNLPPGQFEVLDGESCGSGVIVDVAIGKAGGRRLWVERSSQVLGYSPTPVCSHRNRIADLLRSIKYRLHGRTFK